MNDEKDIAKTDPVDRLLREKKPQSSGKGIAILALLVALAAVSESAWRWWQGSRTDDSGVTLHESVQQVKSGQQQMTQSLSVVQGRVTELAGQIKTDEIALQADKLTALEKKVGNLDGQSEEDKATIAAIQGSIRSEESRIAAVEAGLINVAANSQNSSVELQLAEIGFLLHAASARLQLFGDPDAADQALQAADSLIEALENPMFLSVRQRISASRQALSEVPVVDDLQISSTLTKMQAGITTLPFKGMAAPAPEVEVPAEAGWWASFKNTLSSLVTVRKRVPQDDNLLSLEDKDYLRQGLWLQLESARLSLMRKDGQAFEQSLKRFSETLNAFFENGSASVQRQLQELAALQLAEISPAMPDISAAWTQFQQLRDSRRLLNSTPANRGGSAQPAAEIAPLESVTQPPPERSVPEQPDTNQPASQVETPVDEPESNSGAGVK